MKLQAMDYAKSLIHIDDTIWNSQDCSLLSFGPMKRANFAVYFHEFSQGSLLKTLGTH